MYQTISWCNTSKQTKCKTWVIASITSVSLYRATFEKSPKCLQATKHALIICRDLKAPTLLAAMSSVPDNPTHGDRTQPVQQGGWQNEGWEDGGHVIILPPTSPLSRLLRGHARPLGDYTTVDHGLAASSSSVVQCESHPKRYALSKPLTRIRMLRLDPSCCCWLRLSLAVFPSSTSSVASSLNEIDWHHSKF